MANRKNDKKVRDLVEMMQDPEGSGYIGSDCDTMELYEQELEEMEGADSFYDGELDLN